MLTKKTKTQKRLNVLLATAQVKKGIKNVKNVTEKEKLIYC